MLEMGQMLIVSAPSLGPSAKTKLYPNVEVASTLAMGLKGTVTRFS
jgi:hypothetical protein